MDISAAAMIPQSWTYKFTVIVGEETTNIKGLHCENLFLDQDRGF